MIEFDKNVLHHISIKKEKKNRPCYEKPKNIAPKNEIKKRKT